MLAEKGYRHFPGAIADRLADLHHILSCHDVGSAGERIAPDAELRDWLCNSAALAKILAISGRSHARPVRAILFDKSVAQNWALGWHQDRTICVEQRADVAGYGPYSCKKGLIHVEPPFSVIKQMITLRIHLDQVDETNAPLLIAEGSHLSGRIPVERIESVIARSAIKACYANPGDVWCYSTAILHASKRSFSANRRRVLQVDYSDLTLPDGLDWLGV